MPRANASPMPLTRQLREAESSRDLWKERAADKQQTIKKQRIRIRDLTTSRDLRKVQLLQAESRIADLQKQVAELSHQLALTQQQLPPVPHGVPHLGGASALCP